MSNGPLSSPVRWQQSVVPQNFPSQGLDCVFDEDESLVEDCVVKVELKSGVLAAAVENVL